MSRVIETTVPIPVETLREIIGDKEVSLLVDLSASRERVSPYQALVYLSNLELPVDVTFNGDEAWDVLEAYLTLPTLLKCPTLETMVLEVILHIKGIAECNWITDKWIKDHTEILGKWLSLIDSMSLYMMTTINDETISSVVEHFPLDETADTKGINFVHLFDNPLFPLTMNVISENLVKNYTKYFNDYMFKGKNLFAYWSIPENDVHVLTTALADGHMISDDEFQSAVAVLQKQQESLKET